MHLPLPNNDTALLPTPWGEFKIFTVPDGQKETPHVVLVNDEPLKKDRPPLVRIHSECFTGDVLGSKRCDCGEQLEKSLKLIGKHGGVLIYLRQEGRGIGLANKIKAYALQDQGLDTVEAQVKLHLPIDDRDYADAAKILKNLGFNTIRLLTNNPAKIDDLKKHNIAIAERVSIRIRPKAHNRRYLEVKQTKMGHLLNLSAK